ncbi:hypothetical protein [Rhodopseudomonas sp. B29]|uniref:hypothetical protein n=1 Tax=Rhodopseudomonas sp. B29 TaxID=95607 RepID=UPI00034577B0|nr:hypothetical protein [Rhodopseudomonas sp. B29]
MAGISSRLATVVSLLIAIVGPARGDELQDLPPSIRRSVDTLQRACSPDRLSFESGFVTRKDVNGDTRDDYVLDYGQAKCGEMSSSFCGSAGCLTQVYASHADGTYSLELDMNVRGISFIKHGGTPAMLLDLHGSQCGGVGADPCTKISYFDGKQKLAEVPGMPTAPQAASPRRQAWIAVAAGLWHMRNGAARVSLGYSGTQWSRDEAEIVAVRECRRRGGGRTCKVIKDGLRNAGCLFIGYGRTGRGVIWVAGATPTSVLEQCTSQGYECARAIGGCVPPN